MKVKYLHVELLFVVLTGVMVSFGAFHLSRPTVSVEQRAVLWENGVFSAPSEVAEAFAAHRAWTFAHRYGALADSSKYNLALLAVAFVLGASVYTLSLYKYVGRVSAQPEVPLAKIRELERKYQALEDLVSSIKKELGTVEADLLLKMATNSAERVRILGELRRILGELDGRVSRTRRLARSGQFLKALALLESPLNFSRRTVDSVLDGSELPELAPVDWEPRLRSLLSALAADVSETRVA